ncbi:Ribosomal protein L27e [Ophiocordyceps sinensis CO18]|uniref:60S ribosomal protein L27 n=2 Tax=Ophiocordyceps sinensis TaxID=72228 RepID=T5AGU3_OPHSC|nr:Ribosomal protein L27e [Ophiocordyceps sinensis CO18]
MTYVNLSNRDLHVLEKIKDPESNPAARVVIDPSLSRDPHITDSALYEAIVQRERAIVQTIQSIEAQLRRRPRCPRDGHRGLSAVHFRTRRPHHRGAQRRDAAAAALDHLERSIALLSPATPHTPLSPQAARTLSMAHTQRAAIYLRTCKLLSDRRLDLDESRPEAQWTKLNFEEAASRDLAYGGRYGNQIAKGLAVSVNPTAKLCGQIVREAMKKEYGTPFQQDKMKFLKVGRVAIITRGRFAGKKVVILQPVDNGNKPHPFGHAIVAGIERYPSKITRRMSKARQEKRSKIKPFVKIINYNHLMPTRYTLELEGLKGTITGDTFKEVSQREDAKKSVKKVLEERYTSGKNRWFFTPLRF